MRRHTQISLEIKEKALFKKTLSLKGRILAMVWVLVNFGLIISAQTPGQPSTRTCTGAGCDSMSRAELFIKTFATSGNSKGLRTSDLEQEEKVKLAFYGIDATRVQIEQGKLTEKEGQFIIEGHEQVIRDYVHDKNNEAMLNASSGQISDIPSITKHLSGMLSVARQDSLMGREELAQEAQAKMVRILTTFSQGFADTCEQQTFPIEMALGLERQNELMGTGIALNHCLTRKVSAELSSQGVNYHFETCIGIDAPTHFTKPWKLKISGRVKGEGQTQDGWWDATFLWKGIKTEMGGEMEIFQGEIEIEEDSVKVPNDAGPNAKPNGWVSMPIPHTQSGPQKVKVLKMGIAPLYLIGDRSVSGNNRDNWVEAEVKREDKPCKS